MRYLTLLIAQIIVPITLVAQDVVVNPADIANALDGDWDCLLYTSPSPRDRG